MTRSEEIKELKKFLINLGLKRGDKIMVTSSILSTLINLKNNKLFFTPLSGRCLLWEKIYQNNKRI